MKRRVFLQLLPWFAAAPAHGTTVDYPAVVPGRRLVFPRDHGAHPEYRIEWWYVTGWLEERLGFQITFFRARPEKQSDNPSRFSPRQVLFAHAALSDPRRGRLAHDQRVARVGFDLAQVETATTKVWIGDWRLALEGDDRYVAHVPAQDFELALEFHAKEIVLQGEQGFSRKGHRPQEASYYYSRPHIEVNGTLDGRGMKGLAWLDHEWSSAVMAPEAGGWDWTGLNLFDGRSLMAFRMRAKAGGTYYALPGTEMTPLRFWKSPRTGVEYPVSMQVNDLRLEPLMDDQELDSRRSAGTIYWEGAVTAFRGREPVGRGYLELTGYWRPMKL